MINITYVTLDVELADRILPSICSITILTWEDNVLINQYSTLINPDCEIEEFFKNRHGITQQMVKNAPSLCEVWKDIYDILNNKLVICHYANRLMNSLIIRSSVDYLNMPNLKYACTASISKRTWDTINDYKLTTVSEKLGITKKHNNSLEDAKTVQALLLLALKQNNISSIIELFNGIGFAGGSIIDGKKYPYRAIKDKKNKIFVTKTLLNNKDNPIINTYNDFLIAKK